MKKVLLSCIFFGLSITAAHAATTPSDPTKSIIVEKAKPQFTINLASNPTTGYSWLLQHYNHHLIKLVKHTYQAPDKSMPGAGGSDSWVFEVKKTGFHAPQVTQIKLLYAKPWDLSDNSKSVEFTVVTH